MKTNLIAITNNTLVRAKVINHRTNSELIAGMKSIMIQTLKEKMYTGVAHFAFIKKDGTLREAWGTLIPSLVNKHTSGWGESRELYSTTAFFDVELGAWRSFRWETIVKVF